MSKFGYVCKNCGIENIIEAEKPENIKGKIHKCIKCGAKGLLKSHKGVE